MTFSTRRGRPTFTRSSFDQGTPELQTRRKEHKTSEALDICLAWGLILADEHAAALHWRWLYTLKYGVPAPSQTRWGMASGGNTQREDAWKTRKGYEFAQLNSAIAREPAYTMFVNGCLFNRWPRFLIYLQKQELREAGLLPPTLTRDLNDLRTVLKILKNMCRK